MGIFAVNVKSKFGCIKTRRPSNHPSVIELGFGENMWDIDPMDNITLIFKVRVKSSRTRLHSNSFPVLSGVRRDV